MARVGRALIEWRAQGADRGTWHGSQFKADADQRAHEALVDALGSLAPGCAVLSEEGDFPATGRRPDEYFLIDPLDGTASYAHGYSGFVTQVAFMSGGAPQVAAIRAPELDATWVAERGRGAFLNGTRLRARAPRERTIIIDNYPDARGAAARVLHGLPGTSYLECGSIGLKICRVADGTADLFVKDVVVRDWDVAPADLVLSEAGGCLTDVAGARFDYSGSPEKRGLIAAADLELAARAQALLRPGIA